MAKPEWCLVKRGLECSMIPEKEEVKTEKSDALQGRSVGTPSSVLKFEPSRLILPFGFQSVLYFFRSNQTEG